MLSKMKYLKTYEAMNLRKDLDDISKMQLSGEERLNLRIQKTKEYLDKLKDCYLYIIDSFETKIRDISNHRATHSFMLECVVQKDEINLFLDSLKSSQEKAKYELNSDIQTIRLEILDNKGFRIISVMCLNKEQLEKKLNTTFNLNSSLFTKSNDRHSNHYEYNIILEII